MERNKFNPQKVVIYAAVTIVALFMYVILHELGHCIAVWLQGGIVTEFSVIDWHPHMSYKGITGYNPLVDVMGAFFPITLLLLFVFVIGFKSKSVYVQIFVIVSGITYSGSLLAWILIPVKFLLGRAPVDDDVTKFLVGSHIHPLIVMIGAIVLVAVVLAILLYFMKQNEINVKVLPKKAKGIYVTFIIIISIVFFLIPSNEICRYEFSYVKTEDEMFLSNCYDISVEFDGVYVVRANWNIDEDGVIVGVALKDSNNVYFYSTSGGFTNTESEEIKLSKGEYSLLVYSAANNDEWVDLCNTFQLESTEIDFIFSDREKYSVDGGFQVLRK